MQKSQTKNCRVLVHPAATNPKTIKKIQQATGLIAIVEASKIILKGALA